MKLSRFISLASAVFLLFSYRDRQTSTPVFSVLKSDRTGSKFNNKPTSSDSIIFFKYMYFYNSAGGDVFINEKAPVM